MMRLKFVLLCVSLFICPICFAQTSTLVYYLKNSGVLVSTKDSADYWMVVKKPDTAGKYPYTVYEYSKDGKVRLKTNAYINDLELKYQGRYTAYFPSGKTKAAGVYEDGDMKGRQMQFYPNGNLYCVITYTSPGVGYFGECRDSTGAVLTTGGNGTWKQFNENFTEVTAEGPMENGLQEGIWHFKKSTTESLTATFKHGREVQPPNSSRDSAYRPVEVVPSYPGGIEAFFRFIGKNLKYPRSARENGTQGKVIVTFVVETDGQLSDVKVLRGIGDGCDEESVRVIKLSSPWKPGMQGGRPVRVAYSIPIMFGPIN